MPRNGYEGQTVDSRRDTLDHFLYDSIYLAEGCDLRSPADKDDDKVIVSIMSVNLNVFTSVLIYLTFDKGVVWLGDR